MYAFDTLAKSYRKLLKTIYAYMNAIFLNSKPISFWKNNIIYFTSLLCFGEKLSLQAFKENLGFIFPRSHTMMKKIT